MSDDSFEQQTSEFSKAIGKVQRLNKNDKIHFAKKPQPYHANKPQETFPEEDTLPQCSPNHYSAYQTVHYAKQGVQAKTLKQLRQGQLAIELTCDLHGQTVAQARMRLNDFLQHAISKQCRVLQVIFGCADHSEIKPVLKNHVTAWLAAHTNVLAFHSCLARHGGAGAIYLLLRRQQSQ